MHRYEREEEKQIYGQMKKDTTVGVKKKHCSFQILLKKFLILNKFFKKKDLNKIFILDLSQPWQNGNQGFKVYSAGFSLFFIFTVLFM